MTTEGSAGHRVLPHTADLVLEAWAPTPTGCLEEAARALVDSFAHVLGVAPQSTRPVRLAPDDPDGMLVALLAEVIFVADSLALVPVGIALAEDPDGGVRGELEVAPIHAVEIHGPAPKGVSLGDLVFERAEQGWRCLATIDV